MMWYENDEITHLLTRAGMNRLSADRWFAPRIVRGAGDRHIQFIDQGIILRTEFIDGQKLETTHVRPSPDVDLLVLSLIEHVDKLYQTEFTIDESKAPATN